MLNLRVSTALWFQQRAKKCLRRVFPLTRKQRAGQQRLLSYESAPSDPGPVVQTVQEK
jgi:hypothetical protein